MKFIVVARMIDNIDSVVVTASSIDEAICEGSRILGCCYEHIISAQRVD